MERTFNHLGQTQQIPKPADATQTNRQFHEALRAQGVKDAAYLAELNARRTLYDGITGGGACLPG